MVLQLCTLGPYLFRVGHHAPSFLQFLFKVLAVLFVGIFEMAFCFPQFAAGLSKEFRAEDVCFQRLHF